jgi:Ca2+/Na+ antiporter
MGCVSILSSFEHKDGGTRKKDIVVLTFVTSFLARFYTDPRFTQVWVLLMGFIIVTFRGVLYEAEEPDEDEDEENDDEHGDDDPARKRKKAQVGVFVPCHTPRRRSTYRTMGRTPRPEDDMHRLLGENA